MLLASTDTSRGPPRELGDRCHTYGCMNSMTPKGQTQTIPRPAPHPPLRFERQVASLQAVVLTLAGAPGQDTLAIAGTSAGDYEITVLTSPNPHALEDAARASLRRMLRAHADETSVGLFGPWPIVSPVLDADPRTVARPPIGEVGELHEALQARLTHYRNRENGRNLEVGTDASLGRYNRGSVAGIAAVDNHGHYVSRDHEVHRGDVVEAELAAIALALKHFRFRRKMHIFTDSQSAVALIEGTRAPRTRAISALLAEIAERSAGRGIDVLWVRGHNGFPLNEAADRLAMARRRSTEMDTNPAGVNANIIEAFLDEVTDGPARPLPLVVLSGSLAPAVPPALVPAPPAPAPEGSIVNLLEASPQPTTPAATFLPFEDMTVEEQCTHLIIDHGYNVEFFALSPVGPLGFFMSMDPDSRSAWHADDHDPFTDGEAPAHAHALAAAVAP